VELAADNEVAPSVVESDEALWRGSLDGDGEAFGALFDRHVLVCSGTPAGWSSRDTMPRT
jgi:hypothetical protein